MDNTKKTTNKVEHNYRDLAGITEAQAIAKSNSVTSGSSDRHFPVRLHYMLTELDHDGLSDIVSWQPHGRCFVVHKQHEFVERILPMWFRQTKFASFQRQLNLYGFKRLTTGRDKNGYYHELFLRSKRFLAHRIPRCKLKGQGARKPTSPETEPNFYMLPYLPPDVPRHVKNDDSLLCHVPPPSVTASCSGFAAPDHSRLANMGNNLSLEQLIQASATIPTIPPSLFPNKGPLTYQDLLQQRSLLSAERGIPSLQDPMSTLSAAAALQMARPSALLHQASLLTNPRRPSLSSDFGLQLALARHELESRALQEEQSRKMR